MKLLFFVLFLPVAGLFAQLPLDESEFLSRLNSGSVLPKELLATRTAVFYPYALTMEELKTIQESFQRTGIDAVAYFDIDLLTAGRDVSVAMARYLLAREIPNLAIITKNENGYRLAIMEFNRRATFVEQDPPAWIAENSSLHDILLRLYREASNQLERSNYLINEYPETDLSINPITGRRNEYFAIDLQVDPLAVPKFGNEAMDKALEEIMKLYPFKYTFTEPDVPESELRKQGYLFVLRFVHARNKIAKDLMGYEVTKSASAIASISYPGTQPQVKNIPADTEVYKFYFKHIDSGNDYLGTKWDADDNWQQALVNQIKGLKTELKIN